MQKNDWPVVSFVSISSTFYEQLFRQYSLQKNCKAKLQLDKSCSKHFLTKRRALMLMKLATVVYFQGKKHVFCSKQQIWHINYDTSIADNSINENWIPFEIKLKCSWCRDGIKGRNVAQPKLHTTKRNLCKNAIYPNFYWHLKNATSAPHIGGL